MLSSPARHRAMTVGVKRWLYSISALIGFSGSRFVFGLLPPAMFVELVHRSARGTPAAAQAILIAAAFVRTRDHGLSAG